MMMQTGSPKRIGRLSSWIFKTNFSRPVYLINSLCIITPNFVEIGHAVAEISQFLTVFNFSKHSGINIRFISR